MTEEETKPLSKILDPRVDIRDAESITEVVLQGGEYISSLVSPAQSNLALTNINFNVDAPSDDTFIDRVVYVKCYFDIIFDQPVILGQEDSLRQFPLQSCMTSLSVKINGLSITQQQDTWVHAFAKFYKGFREQNGVLSTCACYPDQFPNYNDYKTFGTARNPMASYGENSAYPTRGSLIYRCFTNLNLDESGEIPYPGVGNVVRVRVVSTEPLLMSPFVSGSREEMGFANLDRMIVNMTMGDLSRVWSHNPGSPNPITTVTTRFYQAPDLLLQFIRKPAWIEIPPKIRYEHLSHQDNVVSTVTVTGYTIANTGQFSQESNERHITTVPRYVYVYLKRRHSDETFQTTDTFATIRSLTLKMGVYDTLFASFTTEQLYNIAVRHGFIGSFSQWSRFGSCVAKIEMGVDAGLSWDIAVGSEINGRIQVKVEATSYIAGQVTYELHMVIQNQGFLEMRPKSAITNENQYTRKDIENAPLLNETMPDYTNFSELSGNAINPRKIKRYIKKGAKFVKKAAKAAETVAPLVATAVGQPELAPAIMQAAKTTQKSAELVGGAHRRVMKKQEPMMVMEYEEEEPRRRNVRKVTRTPRKPKSSKMTVERKRNVRSGGRMVF